MASLKLIKNKTLKKCLTQNKPLIDYNNVINVIKLSKRRMKITDIGVQNFKISETTKFSSKCLL